MTGFDRSRLVANRAEGRVAWPQTPVVMLLAVELRSA
jgi:hypothetical protein